MTEPGGLSGRRERLSPAKRALLERMIHGAADAPATVSPSCAVSSGVPDEESVWCLHERFAEQVRHTPDVIAVSWGGRCLTYGELDARAGCLAARLEAHGVGPEVLVGICAEPSFDLVVGVLGILKAGGAYLALDPRYPPERLQLMVEDAGVSVVVVQPHLAAALPVSRDAVVPLDAGVEPAPAVVSGAVRRAIPENLAYAIYTSGSTGRPKGVLVTHANVSRLFATTRRWFGFDAADVWTLFHSCAFDFSVWELWGALLHGGRLVVVPRETCLSPTAFRDLLASESVTVLNQTPSSFQRLVRVDELSSTPAHLALRAVIFGGEALQAPSLRLWADRRGLEHPRLINMYGITETTVHVTRRLLSAVDLRPSPGSRIGRPLPDLAVLLLDGALQPVPPGEVGEMFVAGAGLARGYLERPDLTAARFLPHPSAAAQGERLYRTGDLARLLPDGDLEYLGRRDRQVKVRGFRVELEEIEAALVGHAAVREAAVVAQEDPSGGARLVAYVTTDDGSVALHDLQTWLAGRLPEHMVPSVMVRLDRLPLGPTGKLDYRALPAVDGYEPEIGEAYEAPSTDLERLVAGIWRDLLGVERVGVRESFFDLGGHSLLMAEVHLRLCAALGREVPMIELFKRPTVGALARYLSGEADVASALAARARAEERRAAVRRRFPARTEGADV